MPICILVCAYNTRLASLIQPHPHLPELQRSPGLNPCVEIAARRSSRTHNHPEGRKNDFFNLVLPLPRQPGVSREHLSTSLVCDQQCPSLGEVGEGGLA